MKGKLRHDFDVSFNRAVNALFKRSYCTDERNKIVEEMTEEYFAKTGEFPSDKTLEKLADFILDDDLRDNSMDKVTKTEYPILSDKQLARRTIGRHTRSLFAKTEVEFIEAEVNHHANTLLNVFLVYRQPGKKFRKVKPKMTNEVVYYENNSLKFSGRTEKDAEWAKKVKDRDGYMCQNPKCESRVGIMHAHHVDSYVDNPAIRTEESNGVTLCSDCHNEFHSIYGKGGNNRQQLNEFFKSSLAV